MKTTDLIGPTLDWAVAKALGYMPAKWEKRLWGRELVLAPEREFSNQLIKAPEGYTLTRPRFEPSNDWAQGGPIIERAGIQLHVNEDHMEWLASCWGYPRQQYGPTPLIAAMRCLVASRLGDEVDVPKELL